MSVYLTCADPHCDNASVCTMFCQEHQTNLARVGDFGDFVLWDLWSRIEFEPHVFETLMSMVSTVRCGRCSRKEAFAVCDLCETAVPELSVHSELRNRMFCLFGCSEEDVLGIVGSASVACANKMLEDPVVRGHFASAINSSVQNLAGRQMQFYMRANKSKLRSEGPLSEIMCVPLKAYFGKPGVSKRSKIYRANQAYAGKHFGFVF